jgi:hypothetical protein
MILNSRQNGFLINLPQDFFNAEVQTRYDKYYRNLLLPYKSISDFMASTIQGVNFPGLTTVLPTQIRTLGKIQEVQSAKPIADMFTRDLKLTFKLTDAYLNYFIFLDNTLNYFLNKVDYKFLSLHNTGSDLEYCKKYANIIKQKFRDVEFLVYNEPYYTHTVCRHIKMLKEKLLNYLKNYNTYFSSRIEDNERIFKN